MFGEVLEKFQNEKTPFNPRSPYAISKVFSHFTTKNYREAYNIFAVSGILFNHESPLRGEEFVTRKITLGLVKILNNDLKFLELGNLNAKRDWGYAKEYVELMWKMLQKNKPDDYLIATGRQSSIKNFIDEAIKFLNINAKWVGNGLNMRLVRSSDKKIIVKVNPKFFRPLEVNTLHGNPAKAKRDLKWKPKTDLKKLVKIMLTEEMKYYNK